MGEFLTRFQRLLMSCRHVRKSPRRTNTYLLCACATVGSIALCAMLYASEIDVWKLTVFGVAIQSALCLAKICVLHLDEVPSQVLYADVMHAGADIVGNLVSFIVFRLARTPADTGHPWGHGKLESMGEAIVSWMILCSAWQMARSGFGAMRSKSVISPSRITIFLSLLTLVCQEGLYQQTMVVGTAKQSPILLASAYHHRSDGAISLAVLGSMAGAYAGLQLDAIGGLSVATLLGVQSGAALYDSLNDLMDGSDFETVEQMEALVATFKDVSRSRVQARRVGPYIAAGVTLFMDGRLSVSDASHIKSAVSSYIRSNVPNVVSLTLDVEPAATPAAPSYGLNLSPNPVSVTEDDGKTPVILNLKPSIGVR
eukprot:GEMP01056552.1.p1 GENE.GEMP01056552.1~~GEMP01056552.1.p1  ORF type:complete len:370 (+),score=52.80 GEMP01056552.1:186-1295(+)